MIAWSRYLNMRQSVIANHCWRFARSSLQPDTQSQLLLKYPLLSKQCRVYSTPRRKNFISQLLENFKEEMDKNKEMKESLKRFREEAQKLEESDALRNARKKYKAVECEASRSSDKLKDGLGTIKGKVSDAFEEAVKTDIAKKAGEFGEVIGKTARGAAESISEKGHQLGKTSAFRTLSEKAAAVKEELNQSRMQAHVYKAPKKLRRRMEIDQCSSSRTVEANKDATGVELHKDSRFYQSWQQFKENNAYVNKVLDWKTQYELSENVMIRATRHITDKVTDVMGTLFKKSEMSETLTEICKLDPSFDKLVFLRECETDIIPNILEAMIQGDLEILKDWCHEGPYNILSAPIKQAKAAGLKYASKILDIDNVDLVVGKMMDQGPLLVISFVSQQILCVKDKNGVVVEGDPDKIFRVNYVWVLCRDQSELNPKAAWRLLDLSASSQEQLY